MGLFERSGGPTSDDARPSSSTPSRPPVGGGTTLVAHDSSFEGTLGGPGDVVVEGKVTGTVTTGGIVRIGSSGTVEARVVARSIAVAGTVRGDLAADERIVLEESADVEGDLSAPRIVIVAGARFDGRVAMAAASPDVPGAPGAGPGRDEEPEKEAPPKKERGTEERPSE